MGKLQILWRSYGQKICAAGIANTALWQGIPWANAQVISAQDSIQTQVVQQNNQFEISGGTTADNARLLFHSFEQFDLEQNHQAEFQVTSCVEAVFSRITNGMPSQINGLIDVIGGPTSLYLINPAGVLFGTDASINLAGDFTVLTAERLDFERGHFGLTGLSSDVQGNVLQLQFNPDSPGNITNLGDLTVGADNSLSLIGHSVVNQGTIRGGAINIAAVGTHEIVGLAGGLQFAAAAQPRASLPLWLTSTGVDHATAIEVNQDGTLSLTGGQLLDVPVGTALVGGLLTTQQTTNLGLNRIQIVGDHVATVGATLRTTDGGQVLIGGDYQGRGLLPTAQSTFIDAASTIIADGEAGGQVVIWSDGLTQFRGAIRARGNTAGGIVEVSGKEQLYFGGQVDLRSQGAPGTLLLDPENIEIRAGSDPGSMDTGEPQILYENTLESSIIGNINLLLQADNNITIEPLSDGELTFGQGTGSISFLADADGDGQGSFTMAPGDRLSTSGQAIAITAADITVGTLNTSAFSAIDNSENAGNIQLTSTRGSIVGGDLISTARGTLNNSGNGGEIALSAPGAISVGNITTATTALSNSGGGGDITLISRRSNIVTGSLNTGTSGNNNSGAGGEVSIDAFANINTADVTTSVQATVNNAGDAGNISLINRSGNITTAALNTNTEAASSNTGNSGSIRLNASKGDITSQQITSITVSPDSAQTQGGDIGLRADGMIVVDSINATGEGQGGNINVTTQQSFRAIDTIADTNASLLTTNGGTIRLTYNSDPAISFSLGDGGINGTAGEITTGLDTLTAPQTVEEVSLETIELNNLFESFPSGSQSDSPEPLSPVADLSNLSTVLGLENIDSLNHNALANGAREKQEGSVSDSELIWAQIERSFSAEFARALNLPMPASPSLQRLQQTLRQVSEAQAITPALMYIRLKDTHVELVLVTGEGAPVYRPVEATAADVKAVVETFHQTITNPVLRPAQYLPAAQQLYDWLVRPILDELEVADIDHIGFVLDTGLRSLPMAALHDGQRFLIENYSIGLLPSAGLTPLEPSIDLLTEPGALQATLAMGVANFEAHADLAAVPFELSLASQRQDDEQYLDHEATLDVLRQRLEQGNFKTVHLATHAVFQPGSLEASYVQLWDQTVNLEQLQTLPLDAVDFLILSACATAVGDAAAEFGFAGLAVNVGVQTALASLWSIDDESTLGLMAEFYRALEQPLTRSAALRQAQLAMLHGQVGIEDGTVYGSDGQLIGHLSGLGTSGSWDFSHPAYWSGFTMIGNPW